MSKLLIEVPIPSMGATVNEITLVDLFCEAGKLSLKGKNWRNLKATSRFSILNLPVMESSSVFAVERGTYSK